MFKCEKCKQTSDRPERVVVERKTVQHHYKGEAVVVGPHGGRGSQIVREENLCRPCAGVAEAAPPVKAELGEMTVIGPLGMAAPGNGLTMEQVAELAETLATNG